MTNEDVANTVIFSETVFMLYVVKGHFVAISFACMLQTIHEALPGDTCSLVPLK